VLPKDGLSPRIELPYTYLMTWFAAHCPVLMKPGEEMAEGTQHALLDRFEGSRWNMNYVAWIRK